MLQLPGFYVETPAPNPEWRPEIKDIKQFHVCVENSELLLFIHLPS